MKILITGAYGQLGTELQRVLREGSAEIGAISSVYTNAQVIAADVKTLDVADRASVEEFVASGDFDLVVNCAAMTDVDGCEAAPETALKVNGSAPGYLARAASAIDAKFVQVSTDYVFAGDQPCERTETDETNPVSVYGRTKLAGEEASRLFCARYFIVRTAWLYGYVGKNFVKTMRCLGERNSEVTVVDDQVGNPTSANDLAYEILKIASTDNYGIYHCANRGSCSRADFAQAVFEELQLECSVSRCTSAEYAAAHPRAAARPLFSGLRNRHLEETLGDEMRHWRAALNEYLRKLPDLGID